MSCSRSHKLTRRLTFKFERIESQAVQQPGVLVMLGWCPTALR